jgi:two-component system OmpR family sensor kinase
MSRVSLRMRLVLAVGVVALLALALADVAVYASLQSYLYRQVDSTLQVAQRSVEAAATPPSGSAPSGTGASPGGGQQPSGATFCAIGRESAPGMFIEVLTRKGQVVNGDECPAFAPGHKAYSPRLTSVVTSDSFGAQSPGVAGYFTVASTTAGGPTFVAQVAQLPDGDLLVVADPTSGIASTLDRLLLLEVSVTGGALAVAVLVGLWLVRLGLRPLRDVVRTAEAITGGDLVHRVPHPNGRTEMGRVAEALNVMLERIQSGFDELQASKTRLRRFVSDASHELRTPIAAVSAYAQLFARGAAHGGDDMGRVMSGIEHETARMARLVEDLLVLARFDERPPLESELVELVGLAMESVQTARMMGPQWPIEFAAGDVVEVMGDPLALRQVIDNLLKNVRAHTPVGTPTAVRVSQVGDRAVVEVEDEGPGLAEGDADLVFERFFRSDPSRSRHTGGAGLGLAIVASIVTAHGGSVEVGRGQAGGALFRVLLPCAPAELLADPGGGALRVALGHR